MESHSVIGFQHLAESSAFAEFSAITYELTGIRLALYGPDQTLVRSRFPASDQSPLCALISSAADGAAACERCNHQHFTEAIQSGQGISYLCHAGLLDMALPILHNGRLVAILSCGQIRTQPAEDGCSLVRDRLCHLRLPEEQITSAYLRTRYLDARQVDAAMRLITFFAQHLCEVYQQLLDAADDRTRDEIERAGQYVRENLNGDTSLVAAASYVDLSPAYLSRLFHLNSGIRFTDYVNQARIDRAVLLLEQTSTGITQVAFECGFNSISQFNRVFRRIRACAPSDCRISARGRSASIRPHRPTA
jgi:AraC-like DNA-binding protein/ligand-binding sensor protein